MYQSDRGSYRTKNSTVGQMRHSCLGRLIILAVILAILGLIAFITRPSEQVMREKTIDNIRQWIEQRDSTETDDIDDFVANIGYIFTSADSTVNTERMAQFNKHNRLKYYEHAFFSTVYIYNNYRIEPERCGIGIFGMVIPTVNFNDFMLSNDTLRRDYNQKLVDPTIGQEEYFGENPDLGGVFQYEGE